MDNLNQQTPPSKPFPSSLPKQTALSSLPPPNPSKPFIIFLVVILIVIAGIGGYILGIKHGKTIVQNQPTTISPTVIQPSPTSNPTANWKTYTHKGLNYQISFPPTWKADENNITRELSIIGGDQKYFIGVDRWIDEERSPEEVARSLGMEFVFPDPKSVLRQSTFNVSKFYYVITGTDHRIAVIPIINKKGSYIVIRTSIWPENESKELFDQILSTFKFTDQNQSPSPTPYIPLNPQIEEEGKLKVKNTPEVKTLIGKYGKSSVSIKALDVKLVKDIQFIMQLDPRFKEQTGCIIVVESNNSGYVYQLDKNNDVLYRQTLEEFKQKTANVDQQILEKFYSSLS